MKKGYVSIIETDIRIKVPDLNYAVASSRLDVENYSIIANTSLINDGKRTMMVTAVMQEDQPVQILPVMCLAEMMVFMSAIRRRLSFCRRYIGFGRQLLSDFRFSECK